MFRSVGIFRVLQHVFPQDATTFEKPMSDRDKLAFSRVGCVMLRHPLYIRPFVCNRILRGLAFSDTVESETPSAEDVSQPLAAKKGIKPLVIPGLTSTQTKQSELFQPKVKSSAFLLFMLVSLNRIN
ncbi:hypothetical protein TSMEX_001544 [Taenia solium]|eukprot:TsM_000961900 transcript=TsM_000961900 gene=TsM_000961900